MLVLGDEGLEPPTGLLVALRVQLGAQVSVENRTVPANLDFAAHAQAAAALLRAERAEAVIWTEQASDGSRVHVWRAAGGDGAEPATVEVRGNPGPDMDRTVALKVSEMLDTPTPAPSAEPVAPAAAAPPPPRPAVPPSPTAEPEPWQPGMVLQLAGVASPAASPGFGKLGPAIAGGVSFTRHALRAGAMIDVTWLFAKRSLSDGELEIEAHEITPALRLDAQTALGSIWLGAHAGLAVSIVYAQGWTADGEYGYSTVFPTSWLAGFGVELPLVASLGLAVDFGVQAQLRRQRFSIEGTEIADSKRLRPRGRIAIAYRPGGR